MWQYDPAIQDGHWKELLFPFEEMQTKPITVSTTEGTTFTGTIWIDRHETDETKHSICLVIPNLPGKDHRSMYQLKVRLRPEDVARISRTPKEGGGFLYHLTGSQIEMMGSLSPPQLTDSDGKTAHL